MIRLASAPHVIALAAVLGACSSPGAPDGSGQGAGGTTPGAPAAPVVDDARTDLVLSWYADGGAAVASRVADVPAEARFEVRVQDPSIPPEKRDASWLFLADLRAPGPNGKYPVRAVARSEFEAKRRALEAKKEAPAPGPSGAPVVMYATRHCPVCKNARRWLLDNKIPYVERDVEADERAAAELAAKGRAQGVATNGVPVFEIHGKLLPGFNPAAITQALTAALPPPPSNAI